MDACASLLIPLPLGLVIFPKAESLKWRKEGEVECKPMQACLEGVAVCCTSCCILLATAGSHFGSWFYFMV